MMKMSLTSRGHICSPIIVLHPSVSRVALWRPWLFLSDGITHLSTHWFPRSAAGDEAPAGRERCDERRDVCLESVALEINQRFAFQRFVWSIALTSALFTVKVQRCIPLDESNNSMLQYNNSMLQYNISMAHFLFSPKLKGNKNCIKKKKPVFRTINTLLHCDIICMTIKRFSC